MKKLIAIILACALALVPVAGLAGAEGQHVFDYADLLTDSAEAALTRTIADIGAEYSYDVVIVTTNSTEGKSITAYADDFYDYNGFGYGYAGDGMLFVVDMGGREYYTSTKGYGITVFTDYGIDKINDIAAGYLSDGDYYGAFEAYLDAIPDFIDQAESGTPYDVNNKRDRSPGTTVLVAFVIGVALAFIITGVMRARMKTARRKNQAVDYVVGGSFNLTRSQDIFLYRTRTRTRIESNSSSGGSSTHRSSSGSTHGGGGGRF